MHDAKTRHMADISEVEWRYSKVACMWKQICALALGHLFLFQLRRGGSGKRIRHSRPAAASWRIFFPLFSPGKSLSSPLSRPARVVNSMNMWISLGVSVWGLKARPILFSYVQRRSILWEEPTLGLGAFKKVELTDRNFTGLHYLTSHGNQFSLADVPLLPAFFDFNQLPGCKRRSSAIRSTPRRYRTNIHAIPFGF